MSDFQDSPAKEVEIEINADGEEGEMLFKKSSSPDLNSEPEMINKKSKVKMKLTVKSPKRRRSSSPGLNSEPEIIAKKSKVKRKVVEVKSPKRRGKRNHSKVIFKHRSQSRSRSRSLCHSHSISKSRSRSDSRSRHKQHKRQRRHSDKRSCSPCHKDRYSEHRDRKERVYDDEGDSRSRKDRGDYDRPRDDYSSYPDGYSSSSKYTGIQVLGNRENPVPNPCLGVFGLSIYTQERELHDLFGRYGHIDNVQVVYDRQSRQSRGFAFIYFRSTDDAYEAKVQCDGLVIDGFKIRVDFSITTQPHPRTPGVFLGRSSHASQNYYRHNSQGCRPSSYHSCYTSDDQYSQSYFRTSY